MIIMDLIKFKTNEPSALALYSLEVEGHELTENEIQEITRRNDTHKAFYDLYRSGELEEYAYHTRVDRLEPKSSPDGEDWTVIYFILDSDKIPQAVKDRLRAAYPSEKISELGVKKYSPCIYTGCVTLVMGSMRTYRDLYGCIGRSWECPIVQSYGTDDISDFARIRDEEGPAEAGKTAIERGWDPAYNRKQ